MMYKYIAQCHSNSNQPWYHGENTYLIKYTVYISQSFHCLQYYYGFALRYYFRNRTKQIIGVIETIMLHFESLGFMSLIPVAATRLRHGTVMLLVMMKMMVTMKGSGAVWREWGGLMSDHNNHRHHYWWSWSWLEFKFEGVNRTVCSSVRSEPLPSPAVPPGSMRVFRSRAVPAPPEERWQRAGETHLSRWRRCAEEPQRRRGRAAHTFSLTPALSADRNRILGRRPPSRPCRESTRLALLLALVSPSVVPRTIPLTVRLSRRVRRSSSGKCPHRDKSGVRY